jgi:replication-associated recombination protein RarA
MPSKPTPLGLPQTTSCPGKVARAKHQELRELTRAFRVEKYRPVFLDDVVGNTETIERLKIIAKDGNMPHVIISGMPGIGKTTSILCLARQLLGDTYKEAVLELNASDERGSVGSPIAEDIDIDFARSQVLMLCGIVSKDLLRKR